MLDVDQHDQEFLAAQAEDVVAAAQGVHQILRDLLQHRVARIVAVVVVDPLEEIDVDRQHRQRGVIAAREVDFARHEHL